MLDFRGDAGSDFLRFQFVGIQHFFCTWALGRKPQEILSLLEFISVFHTEVVGTTKNSLLFAVQQFSERYDSVKVGGCDFNAVNRAKVAVSPTQMCIFIPKCHWLPFELLYHGITLTFSFLVELVFRPGNSSA